MTQLRKGALRGAIASKREAVADPNAAYTRDASNVGDLEQ